MAQGPLSGFRDLLGQDMIPLQTMLDTIRRVYESYGFTPLKTPALERYETMAGKYGEEGEKLMYKFEDHGGRQVALRYDLTVPLARVVSQYGSQLPMPYKRYALGEVWRGDRPQAGRYREFLQFDADAVGAKGVLADVEMITMAVDIMLALGAEAVVKINDRQILDGLAKQVGAKNQKEAHRLIALIDKVEKAGAPAVLGQIKESFNDEAAKAVGDYLAIKGSPKERLAEVAKLVPNAKAGLDNLRQIFEILGAAGYGEETVVFDQTVARGLDYYTGVVYETLLTGAPQVGSVCAGGRYDNLIKALGGPDLPAVGTSVGVDRLFDGLRFLDLIKSAKTLTRVLIVNFDDKYAKDYLALATTLREAGIATEIYYEPAKLDKQLGYANKMEIPFVLLMGPDEIAKKSALIKDLASGDQKELALGEVVNALSA